MATLFTAGGRKVGRTAEIERQQVLGVLKNTCDRLKPGERLFIEAHDPSSFKDGRHFTVTRPGFRDGRRQPGDAPATDETDFEAALTDVQTYCEREAERSTDCADEEREDGHKKFAKRLDAQADAFQEAADLITRLTP